MKNQRIKADNVDQLLEIVKAVQRGEDPGEALEKVKAEKEKAEAIAMAETAAAEESGDSLAEKTKVHRKKKTEPVSDESEDLEEEDEFEKALESDKMDGFSFKDSAGNMKSRLQKAAGLFAKSSDKKKKNRKEADEGQKKEQNVSEEKTEEQVQVSEAEEESERTQEELTEDQEKMERLFEFGTGGGRMLGRERLSSHARDTGSREKQEKNSEENADDTAEKPKKRFSGIGASISGMWKVLNTKEPGEEPDEETGNEETKDEESENAAEFSNADQEPQKRTEESADEEVQDEEVQDEEVQDEEVQDKEVHNEEASSSDKSMKQKTLSRPTLSEIKKYLQSYELTKRGMSMLAGLILAVILLAVIVVNIVQHSIDQKKKRENVAADKGLIVTVENDPQEWCSSHMLELRFKTKGKPVTKVVINGTALQPDANGNVTYAAAEHRLEATAVTEDTAYQAVIEIPKLDAQPPTVYAQRSSDQVVLTASDDRSSIRKIWYAELKDNDYIRLPVYQEYTGAIPYQKGSIYYFYAEDAAGNCSSPTVTTMELAESLQFAEESIMLYPDEAVYLDVQVMPEGALLNGLQFKSSDSSVVTVDAKGKVTALAEGTATITVSADGVKEISCLADVARERTVTLSAIGDCTLGADQSFNTTINFDAFAMVNGNDYFFRKVADILENDDVTFANLEGTLTTSNAREVKQYAFKGDPSYTEILTSGSVEVVTLANNHSSDYGEQSLTDTQMYLTEAGIDYCMGDTYVLKKINGVKTAFIGIYVLRDGMERETQVRETIEAAKADGADLVIAGFHWGSEKASTPDETQTSLAHIAIDCGADLVVGHHPHVLQGIEKYNGKYIVYSLGNFCFGGNTAPSDTDTMIFRQTFTIRDGKVQDDDRIEIVPCSISSSEGYNDYQPMPANEAASQRIMERINQYSEPFGQSYTASTGLE